ncbi:unnamed protein product [Coccothraustes coccothraustes]
MAQLAQRFSCPPNFTAFLVFIHAHIRVEVWAAAVREAGGVPEPAAALVPHGHRAQRARSAARLPSAPSPRAPCRDRLCLVPRIRLKQNNANLSENRSDRVTDGGSFTKCKRIRRIVGLAHRPPQRRCRQTLAPFGKPGEPLER